MIRFLLTPCSILACVAAARADAVVLLAALTPENAPGGYLHHFGYHPSMLVVRQGGRFTSGAHGAKAVCAGLHLKLHLSTQSIDIQAIILKRRDKCHGDAGKSGSFTCHIVDFPFRQVVTARLERVGSSFLEPPAASRP